jgi:hypothetical protein
LSPILVGSGHSEMRARASADFIRQTQAGPQTAWALRFASGNGI